MPSTVDVGARLGVEGGPSCQLSMDADCVHVHVCVRERVDLSRCKTSNHALAMGGSVQCRARRSWATEHAKGMRPICNRPMDERMDGMKRVCEFAEQTAMYSVASASGVGRWGGWGRGPLGKLGRERLSVLRTTGERHPTHSRRDPTRDPTGDGECVGVECTEVRGNCRVSSDPTKCLVSSVRDRETEDSRYVYSLYTQ